MLTWKTEIASQLYASATSPVLTPSVLPTATLSVLVGAPRLAVSGNATRSRTGSRTTSTSLPLKGEEMLVSMAGDQVFAPVAWKPMTGPARKFHCSVAASFSEVLRYVG